MAETQLNQREVLETIAKSKEATNSDRMKALAALRALDREEGVNTQLFRMDRGEIQSKLAALDRECADIIG